MDNLISIRLFNSAQKYLAYAIALIIGVFTRLIHLFELIHSDKLLSMKMLFIEGSLLDTKVILDQELYFCDLIATLLEENFIKQIRDIECILDLRQTMIKELDTIIGISSHACQVFWKSLHFQNHLRSRIDCKKKQAKDNNFIKQRIRGPIVMAKILQKSQDRSFIQSHHILLTLKDIPQQFLPI